MKRSIYRKKKSPWPIVLLACMMAIAMALSLVLWMLTRTFDGPGSSGDVSAPDGPVTTTTTRAPLPKSFIDRNTFSPYVILYDATGGQVLYEKQAQAKCYPASLTKLLTAILAVESVPVDAEFTVGNEVYMIAPGSSRAYLSVGTRLNLGQLLQAMLLPSGNDAAYVTAVQVGRIIAGDKSLPNKEALAVFIQKMNEKAAALGCTGTHFVNPDGYHHADHYTTAADMLKIAVNALEHPLIAQTVSTPKSNATLLSGQRVNWTNTNRLIQPDSAYTYEGATGLKTGTTDEAGYCLAACAVRDGRTSVVIVMGADAENGRWDDATGLLDISFQ